MLEPVQVQYIPDKEELNRIKSNLKQQIREKINAM